MFYYHGGLYLLDDLVFWMISIGVSISVGYIVCMLIVLCLAILWVHSPQTDEPRTRAVGHLGFVGRHRRDPTNPARPGLRIKAESLPADGGV